MTAAAAYQVPSAAGRLCAAECARWRAYADSERTAAVGGLQFWRLEGLRLASDVDFLHLELGLGMSWTDSIRLYLRVPTREIWRGSYSRAERAVPVSYKYGTPGGKQDWVQTSCTVVAIVVGHTTLLAATQFCQLTLGRQLNITS